MSLTFGLGGESDFLKRAAPWQRNRFLWGTMSSQEKEIRTAFGRIADVVGLANDERVAVFGVSSELSRVILALETLGTALDLFGAPAAAVAWLRGKNPAEPFNGRSPLRAMAVEGRLGVEITLIYLQARLRLSLAGDETVCRLSA